MDNRYEENEKRGVQRFDLCLLTVVHETENHGGQLELFTRDISADGAYLCLEDPLPPDTPVELTFFLPVRKQIRSKIQTNGKVVRSDKDGMAVRFDTEYQILAC